MPDEHLLMTLAGDLLFVEPALAEARATARCRDRLALRAAVANRSRVWRDELRQHPRAAVDEALVVHGAYQRHHPAVP